MKEQSVNDIPSGIDTPVHEFAAYLGCDPLLAQRIYDQLHIEWSLDGELGKELRNELSILTAIERSLNRAVYHSRQLENEIGLIQITSQIEGRDIPNEILSIQKHLEELVLLGHAKVAEEASEKGVNRRADLIAEYVAALFEILDNPIGFGRSPIDPSEPSTPFGRAVREALGIFKVYAATSSMKGIPSIANWRQPAQKACRKALQKPNSAK